MADPVLDANHYEGAFALLAEMTHDFAEAMDVQTTLNRALASIVRLVNAAAGSLWLVENEDTEIVCVASVGPDPITGLRLPVTQGIIGKSVRENKCQQVLDVSKDPDFSTKADEESGFKTRSLLCAPVSFSDEVMGAIELINKETEDGCFVAADANLLQVLASSAGLALANARFAAEQVEHERVRRELELAAEIQRNLFPAPRPMPFPIHGMNVPARVVSGDFFDILPLEDQRIAFCLGDVSGKGMNAAILMAKTASLFRCLAKTIDDPGKLMERLNDEVCETATRGMFVTMAAGIYDPKTGSVCIANAGHEPPLLLRRDGSTTSIPAEAPPLGIVPGVEVPASTLALDGGSLYLCSDGLTEAENEAGEALGSEGLQRLAVRFAEKPISERIEAITAAVRELELRDDLTLLGISDEAGRNS